MELGSPWLVPSLSPEALLLTTGDHPIPYACRKPKSPQPGEGGNEGRAPSLEGIKREPDKADLSSKHPLLGNEAPCRQGLVSETCRQETVLGTQGIELSTGQQIDRVAVY